MILLDGNSLTSARCTECSGRVDRPGLFGCDEDHHAKPTKAQEIVWAVERELNHRKGLGWGDLDDDVADELRDTLTGLVDGLLLKSEAKAEGRP